MVWFEGGFYYHGSAIILMRKKRERNSAWGGLMKCLCMEALAISLRFQILFEVFIDGIKMKENEDGNWEIWGVFVRKNGKKMNFWVKK